MTYLYNNRQVHNLAPDQFIFWLASEDRDVLVGPEQKHVPLPAVPLPIARKHAEGEPTDHMIGEGVYDYLRRFPDCEHNRTYAELLRDAYPHYLTDLGAHAVMLDAKDVEPAYIARKLTALKILHLLEPENQGLLLQLCHGYYDLGLTFSELPDCHRHLINAMRYGQSLLKLDPANRAVLSILAEIDMLYCDYPGAALKWKKLRDMSDGPEEVTQLEAKLAKCQAREMPEKSLVEDLEAVGKAMQLYAAKNYEMATYILERLEEEAFFVEEFPSAEFFYLLGMCRIKQDDLAGAHEALHKALDISPDYQPARDALEAL